MKMTIIRIVLVLLVVAVIGLYVYDVVWNDVPPTKKIFRAGTVALMGILAFVRTFQIKRRKPLAFYESQYADILENAFQTQPFWKKKLLCAIRLYNENQYEKSIKYLLDLKHRAQNTQDHYALNLFLGLAFTDLGMYDNAIRAYRQLTSTGNANSRIYSNLGHVLMKTGDQDNALYNYQCALEYDRNNAYAYNNIAQAYFQMHELEQSIPYAKKALEINPKMHQASALLAITHALLADKEQAEKYFHIAISSGRDPKELKEAIDYYKTAQYATEENADAEDEVDES